jgi:tripartite-type tricarboxylate transporter receptor subunit TctC
MKKLSAIAFLAASLVATAAVAQVWPDRSLKLIVSAPAGSTPDIVARLISEKLRPNLGQQVVIENRPGAANIVGAQAAARSEPDGYTFFFATAAALSSNVHTFKSLPYDPVKDFTAVAMIGKGPFFVLVHPSVKANTLGELIAVDKSNPGALSIATEGSRNFTGILASWINKQAGTKMVEVPYANITQGIQDAIAGRVQVIALPIASAVPFIKSGELRAIAVSSLEAMPGFENVRPMASAVAGLELIGWFALVAPVKIEKSIVERMNKAMNTVLADPELKARLAELGFFASDSQTPQATENYIASQTELWGKVTQAIGLQPQ